MDMCLCSWSCVCLCGYVTRHPSVTPLQCPSNLKPMDFNSYSIYHSGIFDSRKNPFSSYPWYIDDCDQREDEKEENIKDDDVSLLVCVGEVCYM